MAVKTITIDMEAYDLLSKLKGEQDSFSDVIKKKFRRRPGWEEFLKALQDASFSEEYLDEVEHVSAGIRKEKARKRQRL